MSKLALAILLVASCVCSAREITLTYTNSIAFTGQINPLNMAALAPYVQARSEGLKEPFYVVLYSPGGAVEPVLRALPELQKLKNVHTITLQAASMAAVLAQIIPGKRLAVPSAEILFHRIRFEFEGEVTVDSVKEFQEYLQANDERVNRICSKRMKITFGEYVQRITKTNWMPSVKEALAAGVIDEVVTVKCSQEIRDKNVMVATYSPYTHSEVLLNICDLLEKE